MLSIPKQVLSDILTKPSVCLVPREVRSTGCHALCQCWGVLARKAVGQPRASQRASVAQPCGGPGSEDGECAHPTVCSEGEG